MEQNITNKKTVPVTFKNRTIQLEIYKPATPIQAPGILYLHELFGLLDVYRKDAEELARRGYLVYLPDMYSGKKINYCVRSMVHEAGRNNRSDNPLLEEVNHLLDQLKREPNCNGKLGMIGMCLTGGFVIHCAMREDMEAPVIYHHSFGLEGAGLPTAEEPRLVNVKRMQGHFSKGDIFCPAKRRNRLKVLLEDRLESHLYPAPHGFRSVSRGSKSGAKVWERTLRFFEDHLLTEPER